MAPTTWLRRFSQYDILLGLGLLWLLINWWDPMRFNNWAACRWGPPSAHRGFGVITGEGAIAIWAGRPYQGIFGVSWTGVRCDRARRMGASRSLGPLAPLAIDWQADDRPSLVVAYWMLVIVYVLSWAGFYDWRRLRRLRVLEHGEGAAASDQQRRIAQQDGDDMP